ncbi:MAG: class I SAM-dependent methyltransferase [Fluviicola sp.]|nr:class I SAM-dependent methyltransferase [Fluviicola sp.]
MKRIPTREDLISFYESDYTRTNYFSSVTVARYNELLDSFEKFRKTNKILDVGAGNGFFLEIAKARGWEVHGTELTKKAIDFCRTKDINMEQGCLDEIKYEAETFDVITSFEVIEHINNPKTIVPEMHRILRKGGKCYVTTPNFNSLLRYRLKAKYDVIAYPNHLCYFTKKTLRKVFSEAKFSVEQIKTTGISLTRIRTSKGSNQEYVSATSDDEMLRHRIEKSKALRFSKRFVNWWLNLFSVGDSLKGTFVK